MWGKGDGKRLKLKVEETNVECELLLPGLEFKRQSEMIGKLD